MNWELAKMLALWIGAAASLVALGAFGKQVVFWVFYKVRIQRLREQKLNIWIRMENEPSDGVKLRFVTYYKKPKRSNEKFGQWTEYKDELVRGSDEVFEVDKNYLFSKMQSANDSYNFKINVPNIPERKATYYSRLAGSGYVVTGCGRVDSEDDERWEIFFVISDEPIHKDSGYPWELKNRFLQK